MGIFGRSGKQRIIDRARTGLTALYIIDSQTIQRFGNGQPGGGF